MRKTSCALSTSSHHGPRRKISDRIARPHGMGKAESHPTAASLMKSGFQIFGMPPPSTRKSVDQSGPDHVVELGSPSDGNPFFFSSVCPSFLWAKRSAGLARRRWGSRSVWKHSSCDTGNEIITDRVFIASQNSRSCQSVSSRLVLRPPSPPKTCHPGHENNVKGNADNCLAPRVQRARTMAEYVRYVRHNILHDLAVSCEERARQHTTHAHSGMIVEQTTSRKSNEAGASPREDEMSRAEQDRAGQPGQRRADHGMS
jgi:hypothetical protein